jgi:glycosyltransferase involved in cell wall biosynthesis
LKVTVATVVRNDIEGFLATAKSVLAQTYHDIEWIVVDGKSNDGTTDYIKRFKHRIDNLCIEPDTGVYDAMNKAIDLASGEWLIFMNAGDVFFENQTVQDFIASTKSSDEIVYGSVIGLEDNQMKFHRTENEFHLGMTFDHQATMVRSKLYKKYRYNDKFRVSGDFDLFSRLRVNGHEFRKLEWLVVTTKPYDNGISAIFKDRLAERINVIRTYFNEKNWKDYVLPEVESFIRTNELDACKAKELTDLVLGEHK